MTDKVNVSLPSNESHDGSAYRNDDKNPEISEEYRAASIFWSLNALVEFIFWYQDLGLLRNLSFVLGL